MKQKDIDRFWSKVDKSGECWLWLSTVSRKNCVIGIEGASHYAVRVAWELERGAPPARIDLRRTCDNPLCIRPDHRNPYVKISGEPIFREPQPFDDMPESPAIYYILNLVNDCIYVGETGNVQTRLRIHLQELKSRRHHNKRLMSDWHTYGAAAFEFGILTDAPKRSTTREREKLETLFMRAYQSFDMRFGYNNNSLYALKCQLIEGTQP